MHVSLDGFTTDSKGGMDWINVDEQMFEYVGERTFASDTASNQRTDNKKTKYEKNNCSNQYDT